MEISFLRNSLKQNDPPQNLSMHLKALWYDAKGDWQKAHNLIQDFHDNTAAWIHAYLHRKEGDMGNAGYWYSRAGKEMPQFSLEKEWEHLVNAL
jgi:hypothetical protein